jgi:hypothetical protein
MNLCQEGSQGQNDQSRTFSKPLNYAITTLKLNSVTKAFGLFFQQADGSTNQKLGIDFLLSNSKNCRRLEAGFFGREKSPPQAEVERHYRNP